MHSRSRVVVAAMLVLATVSAQDNRINACLQNNIDVELTNNANRDFVCAAADLASLGNVSLALTILVDSDDPLGIDEEFRVFTAYGADCDRPIAELINLVEANITYDAAASCREEQSVCQRQNVPINPPAGQDMCVRVVCQNEQLDCDLTFFMDIFESVTPEGLICSFQRTFSLPFYDNERTFECGGGGFFGGESFEEAVLSYEITATDAEDSFRVYHANGDSCDLDVNDVDFVVNTNSSCSVDSVSNCRFDDVFVRGDPDCIIVECSNDVTDCDLTVDIVWSAAGRVSQPVMFIAAIALMFIFFS